MNTEVINHDINFMASEVKIKRKKLEKIPNKGCGVQRDTITLEGVSVIPTVEDVLKDRRCTFIEMAITVVSVINPNDNVRAHFIGYARGEKNVLKLVIEVEPSQFMNQWYPDMTSAMIKEVVDSLMR